MAIGERVDFGVLGTLLATRGGRPVYLGTAHKQRLVLAALLAAEQFASVDWLIDVVWAGRPPESARRNIHQYIYRLRTALGAEVLPGLRGGYALVSGTVDAIRFRELATAGQAALAVGDVGLAADQLHAALDLWRGPAYAEFDDCEPIAKQARLLEQLRLDTLGRWAEAALRLGKHSDVVLELTSLVQVNPYREDLTGHLILALYRADRQADALELFRSTRALIHDELGVEPGPALQRLHQAMLRGDPTVATPSIGTGSGAATATAPSSPRELPRATEAFTGRDDVLRALDGLLDDPAGERRQSGIVAAVVGTAGIGKTALAVHWAHRVAERFPDGQLFVDLGGYAPGPPMRTIDALARMLRALGMPPERIPVDLAEAAAHYRSLSADRRLLVVLDNAASADQVRPLIPGGRSCLVIVTSRDRLTGLSARDGVFRLTLGLLREDEADLLLTRMLGAGRVRAEPEASRDLAEVCSRLPLALRIVLANLADEPGRRIADHVARLRADPIAQLAVGEDEDRYAVRQAFDLSYRNLAEPTRLAFRRLGLVACQDFTAALAAALAGTSEREAARELDRLAANHLVEQRRPGRYGMHDLLRHYASDRGRIEDQQAQRTAAVTRLCEYYLSVANATADLLDPDVIQFGPRRSPVRPDGVHDSASALRWLDAERHNMLAVIGHAARHGPAEMAWLLAEALRGYFYRRRYMVDWLAAANAASTAARAHGDARAQTIALHGLAHLHWCLGRLTEAVECLRRAIASSSPEDLTLHATLAGNLGLLLAHLGRVDAADEQFSRAVEMFERAGSRQGLIGPLHNCAQTRLQCGRLAEARSTALRTLDLCREVGAHKKEASALATLAECHRQLGDFDEALGDSEAALARQRELGDRNGEPETLLIVARILADTGQVTQAGEYADQALRLARQVGNQIIEGSATNALAAVCLTTNDHRRALTLYRRALKIAEDTNGPYEMCQATLGIAISEQRAGRHESAIQHSRAALRVIGRARLRVLRGHAFATMAVAHLGLDEAAEAVALCRRAIGSHRRTGHRPGEAATHLLLCRALTAVGQHAAATRHNRRARDLFDAMNLPVPSA